MSLHIEHLLRAQIERVWGRGETELIDGNYAKAVIDHMPIPGQPSGREALKDVVKAFRTAMPDLKMDLHGVLSCGDIGVDFWTLTGTHSGSLFGRPATGKAVRFSGIDMVRVAQGKITELWHVEEMLQFFGQIGQDDTAFGAPISTKPQPVDNSSSYNPSQGAAGPVRAALSRLERRNLAIAQEHIEQIWARGNAEAAYRLYDPAVVDHNPAPGQRPGIPGIVDVLGWLREAVPNLRLSIKQYVVDGDLAADRWVMRGTHTGAPLMGLPARGKSFEINGIDVIRIQPNGLISDVWHAEEFATLKAQISA
jgi:predicted ester cyclase